MKYHIQKSRIYCETCDCYQEEETLLAIEACPVDSEHTVREGSLCVIPVEDDLEGHDDYKKLRHNLIVKVTTIGFANLCDRGKIIASANFAVSRADRDTVHTLEEQIENGLIFHINSVEARERRRRHMMMEFYNRLQPAQVAEIIAIGYPLSNTYVDTGIEGTESGDPEGMYDYLEATVGTTWENTGLAAQDWVPEGMTLAELVTRVMDIMKNGNYS